MPLDSYITNVTASGTTKIEDNLYQATVKLQFASKEGISEQKQNDLKEALEKDFV